MINIPPIAVCRTTELAEAGAYFTHDAARIPVLVVRDAQGTVRAFVNLCRHRGARLVHDQQGVTKTFTCLLHGWTYDASGQMGGGPLARLARDNPMLAAIRENSALTPLRSELRHGFVWVAPTTGAELDVASFLGSVDAILAGRGLETLELRTRTTSEIEGDAGAFLAAVSPHVGADDVVHPLSEDMMLVLHPHDVSLFVRARRRPESDFGEQSPSMPPMPFGEEQKQQEDHYTLEHIVLGQAP